MENSLASNPEEQTPLDASELERIEISRQQQERLSLGGYEVVASGTVQFLEGTTVAILPFPKSKTGFSLEINMGQAQTSDAKPSYENERDEVTRTYRHHFFGYEDLTMRPFAVAYYRGKVVMGILNAKVILPRPRIWSLAYTLYYAPKPPRRAKNPAA